MNITCKNKAQRVAKWLFLIISLYGFLTFVFGFSYLDSFPIQLSAISIRLIGNTVFEVTLQGWVCLIVLALLILSVISVFFKKSRIKVCLNFILLFFCVSDIIILLVHFLHLNAITLTHMLLCCLMDVIYATLLILLKRESLIKIRQGKTGDGSLS